MKHKRLRFGFGAAVLCAVAVVRAQAPATPPLAFEVAAIKPAPPLDPTKIMAGKLHIGMTINAGRVEIGNLSLADLIRIAYKIKPYQLTGPDWMSSERYGVQPEFHEGA